MCQHWLKLESGEEAVGGSKNRIWEEVSGEAGKLRQESEKGKFFGKSGEKERGAHDVHQICIEERRGNGGKWLFQGFP